MMDSLTIAKMDMNDIIICLVGYMIVFIILSVYCLLKYFQVENKVDTLDKMANTKQSKHN